MDCLASRDRILSFCPWIDNGVHSPSEGMILQRINPSRRHNPIEMTHLGSELFLRNQPVTSIDIHVAPPLYQCRDGI